MPLKPIRSGAGALAAIVLGVLLALAVASDLVSGPVVNNGDFWRVAHAALIEPVPWEPLADRYPMREPGNGQPLPANTLGLLVAGLYGLHRLLGLTDFFVPACWLLLNALFLTGIWRVYRDTASRLGLWPVGTSLCAFVLYSFYFKSLYEESIVLALSPWLLAGIARAYDGRGWRVFVVSSVLTLAAKATMIFVLPVLAFVVIDAGTRHPTPRRTIAALAAVLIAAVSVPLVFVIGSGDDRLSQNAYNRFFNGLGWSAQGVAGWPARNFTDRFRYFYAHAGELQARSEALEPIAGGPFLGTSYWPTGDELAQAPSPDVEGRRALLSRLVAQGAILSHFQYLARHPSLFMDYLGSIYAVTWGSEYRLDHFRTRRFQDVELARGFAAVQDYLMRDLGVVFFVGGLAIFAFATTVPRKALAAGWFLGAPLFIVLGDGYSDFERHMTPYLLLSPLVGLIALQPRRVEVSIQAPSSKPAS
jgi:hypothetical protein